ncbi:hypothetical protein CHH83_20860 [Bacillus sp. 7586-K]|nr:hypothetical protein CHH83_20860 [Bacillus sp. 7586-K]
MPKYRKKPVVIEAVQFNSSVTRQKDVIEALGEDPIVISNDAYFIDTLEGMMKISNGDYIIKGVNGEFYPCKPDIFEKTYEAVD